MTLLFLHGAGGFDDDRPLAAGLGAALGLDVAMPRLSDDDMSAEAWAGPVRAALAGLSADDLVVGHSFGASILLRVLGERSRRVPARAVLLAMPNWGSQGWDVTDYAFEGPAPFQSLSLHHCRDDEVVPFEHLALNARVLPAAMLHDHATGGHQFDGLIPTLAADLRG